MIKFPAALVELPKAEHLGKDSGKRWVVPCSICDRWMWRRNVHSLAGAFLCPECATAHNDSESARKAAYSDAYRRARNEAICLMQSCAGVASPDSWESPGAEWLLSRYWSANEAWENGRITPDNTHYQDDISELADSAVPIYTHNRWQVFTDLCAYDAGVDLEGMGLSLSDSSDMTEAAGWILQEIAYAAFEGFREEMVKESKCEECDEFPCECPEYGECQECGRDAFECYAEWCELNGLPVGQGYRVAGDCVFE